MSKLVTIEELVSELVKAEPEAERRTFNDWWNYGEVSPGNNPYRHESAAWWAWEGWQAAIRARGQE